MGDSTALREDILRLLDGRGAHIEFDEAVKGFPAELRGAKPAGAPHSAWELVEHMRLAQWDILEFSRNPKHVSPDWPEGYWPATEAPPDGHAWSHSVAEFRKDLEAMKDRIRDDDSDLFARIPHGDGQTLLREALTLADHNSYHLGQLMFLRKMLESA
jgi:DinB superfamily